MSKKYYALSSFLMFYKFDQIHTWSKFFTVLQNYQYLKNKNYWFLKNAYILLYAYVYQYLGIKLLFHEYESTYKTKI